MKSIIPFLLKAKRVLLENVIKPLFPDWTADKDDVTADDITNTVDKY
jgi:hypothetical protein